MAGFLSIMLMNILCSQMCAGIFCTDFGIISSYLYDFLGPECDTCTGWLEGRSSDYLVNILINIPCPQIMPHSRRWFSQYQSKVTISRGIVSSQKQRYGKQSISTLRDLWQYIKVGIPEAIYPKHVRHIVCCIVKTPRVAQSSQNRIRMRHRW